MSTYPSRLLDALRDRDARVIAAGGTLSDAVLPDRIRRHAEDLDSAGLRRVASQLDNSPHWLILDLAQRELGAVHVPLPTFFSNSQVTHALESSGAQCVITAPKSPRPVGAEELVGMLDDNNLVHWRVAVGSQALLPVGTSCITYTSGTTGRPKGMCLSTTSLLEVAGSLVQASSEIFPARHPCLMQMAALPSCMAQYASSMSLRFSGELGSSCSGAKILVSFVGPTGGVSIALRRASAFSSLDMIGSLFRRQTPELSRSAKRIRLE